MLLDFIGRGSKLNTFIQGFKLAIIHYVPSTVRYPTTLL